MSNSNFSNLIEFLKKLIKEWIFLLMIGIDLLFVIVQLIFPKFSPPYFVYVIIAMVGIIWASYKIYRDVLARIPDKEIKPIPKLRLSFVEGNEYSFRLGTLKETDEERIERKRKMKENPYYNEDKDLKIDIREDTLPYSLLSIFLRVENIGEIPVDILDVSGKIQEVNTPFEFMLSEPINSASHIVVFPVNIEPKRVFPITLSTSACPKMYLNEAQIASRIMQFCNNKKKINAELKLEYIGSMGKISNITESLSISLLPLCDLYISKWDKIGRLDLVKLAKAD